MNDYEKQRYLNERLFEAIDAGEADDVKILLELGANPNVMLDMGRGTPLMAACGPKVRNVEVVKTLLQAEGIDVNKTVNGRTPLMVACGSNYLDAAQELLKEKDIDVNRKDNSGRTALMVASENGDNCVEMVNALLKVDKIDTSIRDNGGMTASDHAGGAKVKNAISNHGKSK